MQPEVSVSIITYNHAPYIERCIESVLMQKTTFPFEIIIGEDCSTDGTRDIVLDYAVRYPQLIRVITSDSNIGARQNARRNRSDAQGKYLAFCEGDDYWIDPLKLQKQMDALTKYDAIMVAHNTIIITMKNGIIDGARLKVYDQESAYLKPEDIITLDTNIHLSSFFIQTSFFNNLPDWHSKAPVGDVPLKMLAANYGKVFYINEIMSVYNKGTSGSWTDRSKERNHEGGLKFVKDYLAMYKNFDDYSNHKYHDAVRERSIHFFKKVVADPDSNFLLDIPETYKSLILILLFIAQLAPKRLYEKIKYWVSSLIVDDYFIKLENRKT